MIILPLGRTSEIVVQELRNELLIYDLISDKAFHLNQTSAIVYQACDGSTTFAELKRKHKFTDDLIYLALDELNKENLLEKETNYVSPFAGLNRREVIKQVGLASMIALPWIAGVIAPTAAHAASVTCTYNTCIPANQNICAGCPVGDTSSVQVFTSTNGSCSGVPAGGPVTCDGNPRTFAFDVIRSI